MAEGVQLHIEIDKKALAGFIDATEKQIEQASAMTVLALAQLVEKNTFVSQYTQNSKPSKPAGSTYVRTFNLQRSSEAKMVKDRMPVSASWEAKTQYASFVVGKADQQAAIHSGRWPSLEYVLGTAEKAAPKLFEENMKKVTK